MRLRVNIKAQFPLWTALTAGVGLGAATWAWRRDRGRRRSTERLAAATLETLLYAVDANDAVTGQHMRRTAAYALCIAEGLGLSETQRRKVERVALFHDVGKLHAALFDIVHDDSKLTPEERAQIATHPERGAEVLAPLGAFYPELPDGVLSHHERWDGTGYPRRLAGERIPFSARLVAIADTFDAITHTRRYHGGEGPDRGLRVVAEGRGTQFDPHLVDVFLSPTVQHSVERTFARFRREGTTRALAAPARRARPGSAERRADELEASVPDVRFRWRAPSPVANEPDTDVPARPESAEAAR